MEKLAAVQLAAWAMALFAAAGFYNQLNKAWKNLRGKNPEPPNEHLEIKRVEMERRITTAEALVATIGADRAKDLKEIETERRRSANSLYAKLDETKKELAVSQAHGATELRTKIERTEEKLMARIEASDKTTQKLFLDFARDIGELDGKAKSKT